MCLAIPGRIKELLNDGFAIAEFMGVERRISVDLIEKARVGDYVIVHAGFAINKLDKENALETIGYLKELS